METALKVPVQPTEGLAVLGSALAAFCAVLWLGALLGVSFLATPVKFQAPSLDLPTALDVGRVTFALFSRVEWGLCAVLLVGMVIGRDSAVRLASGAGLVLLLLIQALWLLPVLDARVGEIIAGTAVPSSRHHVLYVGTEVAKAILLLGLGVSAVWRWTTQSQAGRSIPCA